MDIRIDRCVLHGPAGDLRRAQQVLNTCPWPPAPAAEVLILRRVSVRARPERLPARLYQATDELMAAGVDGWSEAAAGADCVRFRSEADMLARLSLDLAAGRAADLWFWQSFRRYWTTPAARGLAALWLDQAPRLPALTRILRERRRLAAAWQRLDEPGARGLLPRLVGSAAAEELRRAAPTAPGPEPPAQPAVSEPIAAAAETLIRALRAFGVPIAAPDQAWTTKDRLALVLTLAAERPHWVTAPDAGRRLGSLLAHLTEPPPAAPAPGAAPPWPAAPARQPRADQPRREGTDLRPLPPTAAQPPAAGPVPSAAAGGADAAESGVASEPAARDPTAAPAPEPIPGPAAPETPGAAAADDADIWQIAQGGLFYLLNLLDWRPVRERLFADPRAMAFPSGWGWLYRLGGELDLAPEPALIHCLARLSGLEAETFDEILPPLEAAPEIAALGAERYARFGLWRPELLRMPARVHYRRPELDIHYAMNDLDIAVRGAALDIDPGWIDWLGTLVRFHYR